MRSLESDYWMAVVTYKDIKMMKYIRGKSLRAEMEKTLQLVVTLKQDYRELGDNTVVRNLPCMKLHLVHFPALHLVP